MNTMTRTRTYTKTDIQKVFECFDADLHMLAMNTGRMSSSHADEVVHDVLLLAEADCLSEVHIQLSDAYGKRLKSHKYSVQKNTVRSSDRPGANQWPRVHGSRLNVILVYSDASKAQQIKRSGNLMLPWSASSASTTYSDMSPSGEKQFSSNGYGLQRTSFSA